MLPTSRRLLQICVIVGGCVPVCAGLAGVVIGPDMVSDTAQTVAMDSHYRYLSGLLLGIGLGFWSLVPQIEKQKGKFQMLAAITIIGGLARLTSLITIGPPHAGMMFGLGMELVIVPLLTFWQSKI